jgi:hypothetical protein
MECKEIKEKGKTDRQTGRKKKNKKSFKDMNRER